MNTQVEEILKYVTLYSFTIGFVSITITAGIEGRALLGIVCSPIASIFVYLTIWVTLEDLGVI